MPRRAGGSSQVFVVNTPPQNMSTVNILPSRVTAAQTKATGNTTQWQAFKSRLDGQLNSLVSGAYEGGNLPWLADYALGYQCLKSSDTATAATYADKAMSLLLSVLNDDIRSRTQTRQWLARGDGATTVFTLPQTPVAATFKVYTPAVNVATVTRHTADVADNTGVADVYYQKVSNSSDGTADYVRGTDWTQSGDYPDNALTWLGTATHPADGATYYVSWFDNSGTAALSSGYTLSGNSLTFSVAPAANTGIFVEYIYGTQYRQTGNGYGGYSNIFIDSAFTARYLFYAVCVYDWLYDYAGFDAGTKAKCEDLFARWVSFLKTGAYSPAQPSWNSIQPYKPSGYDGLQSNYEAGYYAFRAAAGVALSGHGVSGGSTVLSDIVSYRASYENQALRATPPNAQAGGFSGTYLGGWWGEGWEYSPQSITNVLRGSDILYQNNSLATLTDEAAWAGEVLKCLVHSQATTSWFYPGGDVGSYPPVVPPRDFAKVAGTLSSDSNAAGYAVHYQSVSSGTATADAFDLLYYDPTAASVDWTTTEPDYYYAQGDGLVLSRKDWTYASMWCSFELGNFPLAGHNTFSTGTVFVNRGSDDLLVCATEAAVSESSTSKLINGNFVLIGTTQVNPGNSGHDTLLKVFEGTTAYTYAEGNYANAYYTGGATPATELTRSFFHVRASDYLFVYDRAATTSSATVKQLQWYFNAAATLTRSTDAWTVARGTSKLFGKTYSSTAITSANDTPSVVGVSTPRVTVNPTSTVTSLRYATVMQVAPSATAAMDASAFVTSSSGAAMEGVLIGTVLVLFGKTLTSAGATGYQVTTPTTYSYTAPGGTLTHYVCDLTPNQTYTLSGAATGTATASAAGVLTFTTTGSGSQTVTIT